MSAVADKLREAKALIERGWTQGVFHERVNGCDRYCMSGALREVVYGEEETSAVARPLKLAINPQMRRFYKWNDAPERTQAEVLAAFDRAIELAEAQGQ